MVFNIPLLNPIVIQTVTDILWVDVLTTHAEKIIPHKTQNDKEFLHDALINNMVWNSDWPLELWCLAKIAALK